MKGRRYYHHDGTGLPYYSMHNAYYPDDVKAMLGMDAGSSLLP
jgi:hypothetical protein